MVPPTMYVGSGFTASLSTLAIICFDKYFYEKKIVLNGLLNLDAENNSYQFHSFPV